MFIKSSVTKTAFCLLVVAIVLTSFLGAAHLGMDSGMGGQMGPCPLMPGVAICNMTPLQHMAAAQSMFTTLPHSSDIFSLLLLLLASVLAAAVLSKTFLAPPRSAAPRFVSRREDVPFSPILEAFSNGVIHSKAF